MHGASYRRVRRREALSPNGAGGRLWQGEETEEAFHRWLIAPDPQVFRTQRLGEIAAFVDQRGKLLAFEEYPCEVAHAKEAPAGGAN